ncbi:MAG: DUF3747 domain-containing protein [Synechococcales bacterium]|nr:DUF3747 domain-containing protein [Synechococcales bacterium]
MTIWFRRHVAAIAAVAAAAAGAVAAVSPAIAALFDQKEVDQNKFVAVAAPYGQSAHQLLILEQISSERPCWRESGSAPVQVDPLLTQFDFTGICGRSTDSNGYSIRVDGEDLGLSYSLRVVRRNEDLVLIGSPLRAGNPELEVARANGVTNGFAKLQLNPGWNFAKRLYNGQTLGHVYLTYNSAIPGVEQPGNPLPADYAFPDIANDIYAAEIQDAVEVGFVAGFSEDNTFRPQQTLTREQLVSMVLEALDEIPDVELPLPAQASSNPYPDVNASRWSAAKIQFARDNNIISGYEDGTFRPSQVVTRAELMAVLRRAAEYGKSLQGEDATLWPSQDAFDFADTSAHWAAPVIDQMSSYCGVASPLNEAGRNFYPNSESQRNYAAAATLRMLNCVSQEEAPSQEASL